MDREPQTVLVFSGEPARLRLLVGTLARAGYRALSAGDADELHRVAAAESPDIVVCESSAATDAEELARRLRRDERLSDTRIVVVGTRAEGRGTRGEGRGAYGSPAAAESGQTEADEQLEPGFDPVRLVRLVALLLERARASAASQGRGSVDAEIEKLRSLGQLSAGVAHNFNNALTAILGRAQLMLRQTTDENQRRSLRIIETAARDAAEIVRRVQNFARRAPEARFEQVSLSQLVSDCLQLTRTRWESEAHARGVQYDVRFEDESRGLDLVSASASELREVFVNLIFNALDAMPGGGSLLLRERRDADEVVVEVADTGAGIAPEVRARIFEPFFTTKGKQGSGLGLAVSHGIVARHGGSLSVESEAGRGTTFAVRLPCCVEPDDDASGARGDRLPRRRILVVDDDASVRDVLAEMLAELGQEAVAVAGAHEALGALAASRFDLVITDLSMPGMDGLRLAAEARRASPGTRLALATGYGRGVPADATANGLLDAVIDKPFQLEVVEAALRRLFPN